MNNQFERAPHARDPQESVRSHGPNAALLIDFDNVTMGMRDDLSNDLKALLDSDVIRGKVAVQRAYADWRRYPQYIVSLSEASIDLIFAPAYGSSKKNATDIRLAIDALELVFTRPEIGVYILLSGDSDFSSLVLKLKEYGKYVIGVGIRESSSDILVQNCDEYYSYTALAGLQKETGGGGVGMDPWELVEEAVGRMRNRGDVMRSDRLKQVMLEIDQGFDEKDYGYSKFSKFITDAASRDLLRLKKMENGQYEVQPSGGGGRSGPSGGGRGDGGRGSSREGGGRPATRKPPKSAPAPGASREGGGGGAPLEEAHRLLTRSIEALTDPGETVRDSDVKRRMLEIDPGFDEGELGFSKFSRFLQHAEDEGIVRISRTEDGNYQVSLVDGAVPPESRSAEAASREARADAGEPAEPAGASSPRQTTLSRLRRRRSGSGAGTPDAGDEPPILEGQALEGEERDDEPAGGSAPEPEPEPAPEPEARSSVGAGAGESAPSADTGTPESAPTREPAREGGIGSPDEEDEGPPIFEGQGIPSGGGEGASATTGGGPVTERPAAEPSSSDRERADAGPTESREGGDEEPTGGSADTSGQADEARAERAAALRMRRGSKSSRRRSGGDDGPSLLEGQAVTLDGDDGGEEPDAPPSSGGPTSAPGSSRQAPSGEVGATGELADLNLPTDEGAITRYLANRYRGVGEKTAERLVDAFGTDVFRVLHRSPDRVRDLLTGNRADQVLDAWQEDHRRRSRSAPGSGA